MKIPAAHSFDCTPKEAILLQERLRRQVIPHGDPGVISLIAGADASYAKGEDVIYAVVVVLTFPELTPVEYAWAEAETTFPYIPGLLTFREGPALLEAFRKVQSEPEVILFDGQGIAHPRSLGIASHMGVLLDRPTVGVAKRLLTGTTDEPARDRGATSPITSRDEVIGMAVRTKSRVKPVYVSVGHRIDLEPAVRLVLAADRGYRLPEPTRQAHLFSNTVRRHGGGSVKAVQTTLL